MDTEDQTEYSTGRDALERDSDVTFFVASGPGGQHRNKVETGVRLLHRPTGIVVTATERRSQSANREVAFERLAERLRAMRVVRPARVATRPSAAARQRRRELKRRRSDAKQARRPVREE
jgi:protein subunit release factor B